MSQTCNCGCEKQYWRQYWIELDKDGEPTGHICSAFYRGDRPMEGNWILVREQLKWNNPCIDDECM